METNVKTKKDTIINIILLSLIGLIVFFIIMVLYIPKLSKNVIGIAAYQNLTGYDSTLNSHEMLLVKDKSFSELEKGEIIIFNLKGYGESDGKKAYKVMAQPGQDYYHVHSTDNPVSFPWNITEDMYEGVVVSKVPYIGTVTGFFGSVLGIIFIVVNGLIITAIVYIVKQGKKDDKRSENAKE